MSGGNDTPASFRDRASDMAVQIRNLVRRVVVTAAGALWQATGYLGEDGKPIEIFNKLEVFGTAGFQSRPATGSTEAVVAHIGASDDHRVIVATKDKALERDLASGEATMTTDQVEIRMTAQGKIALGGDATITANPLNGVATGLTLDSWGQPIKPVSSTVFAKP